MKCQKFYNYSFHTIQKRLLELGVGGRGEGLCHRGNSRVSEPGASYKNRRLRNPETPCRLLLLELMKAYIFDHSRNITKKYYSRSYYILSFGSREPAAPKPWVIEYILDANQILGTFKTRWSFTAAEKMYCTVKIKCIAQLR